MGHFRFRRARDDGPVWAVWRALAGRPCRLTATAVAPRYKRGKASGIIPITNMSGLARNWNAALGVFTTGCARKMGIV